MQATLPCLGTLLFLGDLIRNSVATMADQRKLKQHDRLKDALRENLKRRKAQARARSEALRVQAGEQRGSDEEDAADSTRDG